MRMTTVFLLAALASPPTFASCPPPGHDRASLIALKEGGFAVADAAERHALAGALLACLGSPDPAMRDGVAFEGLSTWMRAGAIAPAVLRRLRTVLYEQLEAPDPDGVLHPFAALVLSEVARTDRIAPWMEPAERAAMLDRAAAYLRRVEDYRGFEPGIGWRHGVAHGADWLLQLALNPALDAAQLRQVLDAVAVQAVPAGAHAYVFGEPERLARPLATAARRDLLDDGVWETWLERLQDRVGAMPGDGGAAHAAWLARRHDARALLASLYLEADQTGNPALARLKPLLAKALAVLP